MRTIRFRGKRIDNGKWIYGDLVHDCDGKPIINIEGYSDRGTAIHYRYLVKRETIGQFTGLLDKNGKEIYEGDIVSVYDFSSAYSSPYTGKVIMRGGQWCVEYYKEYRCCPPLFFDDFADRKTEILVTNYQIEKTLF